MTSYTGAEVFIELLVANGVEHIFYNPGFEVVPVLPFNTARYRASGKPCPTPIMCLHESTALNAAHGHYMVSGRPQAVLVHAELGTQQIGGAIQQAWWGRVPVLICAANMVTPGRLNWKKEPYDQGAMLRNCVKWDHEVGQGESFHDVLQQAFQAAISTPPGPVYVSYPVSKLSEKENIAGFSAAKKVDLPEIESSSLEKAAEILINAVNPIIMTSYAGRNPETVGHLVELAELLGVRVVTNPVRMNFPANHPLCAGVEPTDGTQSRPYFLSSDAILVVDYDIPYAYPNTKPNAGTGIIHIDMDFIKQGEPLWNRTPDIAIRADSAEALPALARAIRKKMTPELQSRAQERFRKIQAEHLKIRGEYRMMGKNARDNKPISPEWLAYCINEAIDEDTIVVNQTITPSSSVARQILRTRPGTLVACAGGTIGWALGAARGARIATGQTGSKPDGRWRLRLWMPHRNPLAGRLL